MSREQLKCSPGLFGLMLLCCAAGTPLASAAFSDQSVQGTTVTDQQRMYHFLASGRWFRNQSMRGLWEDATDTLPVDFKNIPPKHPKVVVRVSVPGTDELRDAILLASIPQVAIVNRRAAAARVSVQYVGEPNFKPIPTTTLYYAVNTPSDIIVCAGKYYPLEEGVWFVSSSPKGPWAVADLIPPRDLRHSS